MTFRTDPLYLALADISDLTPRRCLSTTADKSESGTYLAVPQYRPISERPAPLNSEATARRMIPGVAKDRGITMAVPFSVDCSSLYDSFHLSHPHDDPRTWIRGRMAPRRLRPAGFFVPLSLRRAAA